MSICLLKLCTLPRQPRRRCLSSLSSPSFNLGPEIKFTHFLISAPFIGFHTLLQLQIHSLKHPTQIASRRAGLIFNSRYDLNARPFIVLNNAPPPSHCLLPLSDNQRDMTVLFISTFALCPTLEHQMPHATYLRSLQHFLKFTLFRLIIVLFQYCPIISTARIVSKPLLLLSTLHSFVIQKTLKSLTTLFSDLLPLSLPT